MKTENVIKVRELSKTFGTFKAVDQISFEVNRGEIFGFLGANGAGKTTAMRMLTGLLKPTSGAAEVAGFDVFQQSEQIKRHIGYMSQKFSLYEDLSIAENIYFFGRIYGMKRGKILERREQVLAELNLSDHARQKVGSLPLGWKQKLSFAVSMLHEPAIVFLDEPTGGVDPLTRRQFWEMIYAAADKGVTLFVTTHYMDEAEYCNRVSIMVDGRIAAMDTPWELKKKFNAGSIDDVFVQLARGKH